jgi:hypothetical protein
VRGRLGLAENLADLPAHCGKSAKRNPTRQMWMWVGCKLHMTTADGGSPVAAAIMSVSRHGSQVAIPLMQMT